MSKEQLEKVAELLRAGWLVTDPPTHPQGAPVHMQDPTGKKWVVDGSGVVIPG